MAESLITLTETNTRHLSALNANHARWARATPEQRRKQGEVMRAGKRARRLAEIDPEGLLTPAEQEAALDHVQQGEMAKRRLQKAMKQERRERGKAHK